MSDIKANNIETNRLSVGGVNINGVMLQKLISLASTLNQQTTSLSNQVIGIQNTVEDINKNFVLVSEPLQVPEEK